MLRTFSILKDWHTRQMAFVMAYHHATIKFDIYLGLPNIVETKKGSNKTHVLKLLKNWYGQKKASGFGTSIWSPDSPISRKLHLIQLCGRPSVIVPQLWGGCHSHQQDKGHRLRYQEQGIFEWLPRRQHQEVKVWDNQDNAAAPCEVYHQGKKAKSSHKKRQMLAASIKFLHWHENDPPLDNNRFSYCSNVEKLNFLEKSTWTNFTYATHQCDRFNWYAWAGHSDVIVHLSKYMFRTIE